MLDVEARQVGSGASELDTATRKQPVTTGEIDSLLGGMVRYVSSVFMYMIDSSTHSVSLDID